VGEGAEGVAGRDTRVEGEEGGHGDPNPPLMALSTPLTSGRDCPAHLARKAREMRMSRAHAAPAESDMAAACMTSSYSSSVMGMLKPRVRRLFLFMVLGIHLSLLLPHRLRCDHVQPLLQRG